MMGGASWPSVLAATSTAAAFVPGIAHLFHQRDGEGAGGDDVGDTGAGHQAGKPAAHDGRLGRSALEAAQQTQGQLDEILAGAGLVQHGAEEHEKENDGGRHIQRNAVDTFGGHGHLAHEAIHGYALEGDQVRHIGAHEGIKDKETGDHRQGRADHPPGRFQQQHRQDHTHDDVAQDRVAVALGNAGVIDGDIEGRKPATVATMKSKIGIRSVAAKT